MLNALETNRGWDGNDVQIRTLFDFNAFAEREADTHLDMLYYYWSALEAGSAGIPRVSDFKPEIVLTLTGENIVGWNDVSRNNPQDFVMNSHPDNPVSRFGAALANKRITEFPNKLHAKSLVLEYFRCKHWKVPLYHEIDQVIDGIARHYTRLMLPLADDAGAVTQVYYGVRRLAPPRPLFLID
jgi:hypothetical protein